MTEAPLAHYPDLAGKVALVTGGSRGIGAATVKALAMNEVSVAVNGRDEEAIDAVVRAVTDAGGSAIGVPADVCDWGAIEAMRERVERELGAVDVLVPFAGGFGGMTPVHEISEEEWHSVIESNLTSTFLTVKSFLPLSLIHI